MVDVAKRMFDMGLLDTFSRMESPVHKLDPRAKLVTTALFILTVLSFDRYAVSALLPYLFYPLFLLIVGGIPVGYLLRKMAYVAPFALLIGMFNPLLDTAPMTPVGSLVLSGGWISFSSIMLRFVLTVGATLALVAVTGLYPLLSAADRLGAPRVLTIQLMFFHRYLFVLAGETLRTLRARSLRDFGARLGPRAFGSLVGHLLLRTLDRAERIHRAMTSRGFEGKIHLSIPLQFNGRDALFIAVWGVLFGLFRTMNISQFIGGGLLERLT